MRTAVSIGVALFLGLVYTIFALSLGLALAAMLSWSFEWSRETLVWHGRIFAALCYIAFLNRLVASQIKAWPKWLRLLVFVVAPLVLMMRMAPYSESYAALYGLVCIAALPTYQLAHQLFFRRG